MILMRDEKSNYKLKWHEAVVPYIGFSNYISRNLNCIDEVGLEIKDAKIRKRVKFLHFYNVVFGTVSAILLSSRLEMIID